MSQAVRVDLREATLSESASLTEGEGDQPCFVALDSPPPVRSLLRIHVGEDLRVFEVGRVIEVVDEAEPERGCYGHFVDAERLAEQNRVGSEHLEPGISGGVPAPVVIMNTGDMMLPELGSEDGGEGDAPAEGDAPPGEGDTSAEGDAPPGEGDTSAEGDAPPSEGDTSAEGDAPPSEGDTSAEGDASAENDAPVEGDAQPE